MATPGQPTLYKPEYCELAHNYCLLGATNEVLAEFFDVAPRTVDNWITTHPDFTDAVKRGPVVADAKVARALFQRACGFSHQVSRTTLHQGEEHTISNTVSYPPDMQLRAPCCLTGSKPHFSVAMATENSIDRLARTLWETTKRGAERAERSETPGTHPALRIRQRFSRQAARQPVCTARRSGNGQKPAETVRRLAVSP
jgi:hypothetical protein